MNEPSARFYFGNLLADVTRCIQAAVRGDEERYAAAVARARGTANFLRPFSTAHEEALLLLRALVFAKEEKALPKLGAEVDRMMLQLAP